MSTFGQFVIRVYGIAVHKGRLLVVDEYWFNTLMTKFPGGGLEFGEGLIDCLKRECMEEFGQEVEVLEHFYTTDFFQETRFLPGKQLISIYYLIAIKDHEAIKVSSEKFDFARQEGAMAFRWIDLDTLTPDDLTLPIDKKVAGMICTWWEKNKEAVSKVEKTHLPRKH